MIRLINEFKNKEGIFVLIASLFTKVCSFLVSLILIRILSPDEFGTLSYVLSALAFFIPFSGGGIQYSFMRFAPMIASPNEREGLFKHTFYRGLLYSGLMALFMFLLMPWLNDALGNTSNHFYWLIIYLFSFFVIELVKTRYRVNNQNRKFASLDAYTSGVILLLGCSLAYFYGALAYLIVLVTVPMLIGLFHIKFNNTVAPKIPAKYYSYGMWVGVGAIASQLMYSLDVFLVGKLIQDSTQVAIYRSASIIPIALFFIPNSYITTHYADIAKNSHDKTYLIRFAKDYIKLFSVLILVLATSLYFLSDLIITVLFGQEYIEASSIFQILILGMVGAFILRIPFGNLLAAVGKSNWNAVVAFTILVLNGVLNYYAINAWGIVGAAIVTSALLWISGIISFLLFVKYIKRINS